MFICFCFERIWQKLNNFLKKNVRLANKTRNEIRSNFCRFDFSIFNESKIFFFNLIPIIKKMFEIFYLTYSVVYIIR